VTGTQVPVSATAYCLRGRTATGVHAGPGVIAVDPNVIPLGSRVNIPGYGEAVAADTGPAIQGNEVDVWLPSACTRWGRRSVTVTVYP
jgi:3D (Asp-Asp-Asp) domain-containing protein